MSLLLHSFYNKARNLADSFIASDLPLITRELFYDHTYTPIRDDATIENIISNDGGYAYRYLLKEICDDMYKGEFTYLCDSSDIDEDLTHGDFNYYVAHVSHDVPFLFACPPFPWSSIPVYLTIYDPKYQIDVKSDKAEIEICRVNKFVRDALLSEGMERKGKMIKFLTNSDRPRLDRDQIEDLSYMYPVEE